MKKISLIPGSDQTEPAAFSREKMDEASIDSMKLSSLLAENLGHFATLLEDGAGFAVYVRDGEATVTGIKAP
ncbi:hypothetical protein SAMN05216376_111159 [Mameliella alba]|uniref:hypothetical protein n=1 Tax=Mameliella alba TaxID=561184 RepID=UPI00088315D2|nr:hypothetical protein [Mameliella alba]OWV46458.1 hypothetical protein CDZ96_17750 [Mameliella alba]PTR37265.1 hypothetical protein LX94_03604 [Mameliella alba]GGF73349.1 hypothetical protein GCM10011319_37360 [Mameliella alba]SDD77580.1 hypothetical protein SAMN05216376_111159 [Mameliella alba]